jgi:hypothetical protein
MAPTKFSTKLSTKRRILTIVTDGVIGGGEMKPSFAR